MLLFTAQPRFDLTEALPSGRNFSLDSPYTIVKVQLEELEDKVLSQTTESALKNFRLIGVETFTSILHQLANGEAGLASAMTILLTNV